MRVGLFTDTYHPQINGVATSVVILKEYLERLGHEVYVFTTTDVGAKAPEESVYRVPSVPVMSGRRLGMFYQPRLARLIKALNLDLIHTHTEFSLGIFGRMMAHELDIPLVHTYHTIYEEYTHFLVNLVKFEDYAKSVARKISISFCNSANRVIVPTQKVKELLLGYGVTREMEIVPTGINLDMFAPKVPCNGGKQILYLGRVSKEKNIEELLTHLKPYLKAKQDVKFVIVGGGPELGALKVRAQLLGIEDSVVFKGEIPWNEVDTCYRTADVFVSASQSETQGITYIEALAAGLPVVAKADPCLDGVIENGVNGYTFTDQATFLTALTATLGNEAMSLAAMKSADKFSARYFAESVEELYVDEVLKQQVYAHEGDMKID